MKLSQHSAAVDVGAVRGYVAVRSSNAVAILVLGILSLTVCAALGPVAWVMGNKELARVAAGEVSPEGVGMVNAGKVCGIIGTVLLGLTALWVLFVFGFAIA